MKAYKQYENYEPKSLEKLQQLAQDVAAGKIFYINVEELKTKDLVTAMRPSMTFKPLGGYGEKNLSKTLSVLFVEGCAFWYEYLDKSKGTNKLGDPIFDTMQVLRSDDARRLLAIVKEIKQPSESTVLS
jgi:hypothetical protein